MHAHACPTALAAASASGSCSPASPAAACACKIARLASGILIAPRAHMRLSSIASRGRSSAGIRSSKNVSGRAAQSSAHAASTRCVCSLHQQPERLDASAIARVEYFSLPCHVSRPSCRFCPIDRVRSRCIRCVFIVRDDLRNARHIIHQLYMKDHRTTLLLRRF